MSTHVSPGQASYQSVHVYVSVTPTRASPVELGVAVTFGGWAVVFVALGLPMTEAVTVAARRV